MKLTDTQLVLLSAASQRDDRAIEIPDKLRGGAAQKVVIKLLAEGLVEEVRSRGGLPVWRRDESDGPRSLRITKRGLAAIRVEDETGRAQTDEPKQGAASRRLTSRRRRAGRPQPTGSKREAGRGRRRPISRDRTPNKPTSSSC